MLLLLLSHHAGSDGDKKNDNDEVIAMIVNEYITPWQKVVLITPNSSAAPFTIIRVVSSLLLNAL